ncbi:MAG: DEAD/DEAH box helicase [Fimbriiglobus sp.]
MDATGLRLSYDRGTVLLSDLPEGFDATALPGVRYDERTLMYRAQARDYRGIVEHLIREKIPYTDQARGWPNVSTGWKLHTERKPHPHQAEGMQIWWQTGRRGTVVLPTGTGKTFLAVLCIEKVARPTLIITPTLDLLRQWQDQLREFFQTDIGAVGGGDYDFQPITVTTYDSAYIHVEKWGNKYGFLVFDEAHHLPGATYMLAANASIAPFRLGLTATPERADGGEMLLPELIGPIVYRREINELSGLYLADYETRRVYVDLTPEEEEEYRRSRDEYKRFLSTSGVDLGGPNGWQKFLFTASRTPEGLAALRAYRRQKEIERSASGKFTALEQIITKHAGERALIFTADNATVYKIARRYLVPAITHQTKTKERKQILERFHSGEYAVLVTSQVLNEGVDVPAASVGIVLSGSGSIKENVQRLGRILRKYGNKQASLYEVVARGTAEEFTSDRRRQHSAFG